MPRRTSTPSANQERSPPRHPDLSISATTQDTSGPPQLASVYPSLTEAISAPAQPTYSETILQRPTLAVDPSALPPQVAQAGPSSATSRRRSSSSMRTASMTFENITPSQTPTGRISKAKKGKRVHTCEFPGCGKVFTRAEHRRRHELNHNPDALFRCQQPGCGKTFHRADLLQRHQERHDVEGSPNLSSAIPQHSSMIYSTQPTLMPPATISSTPADSDPRTSSVSIPSLVHPPTNPYNIGDSSLNFNGGMYLNPYTSHNDSSYFYGSDGSQSPASDSFGHLHRPSISSASSVTNLEPPSLSPTMTTSVPSQWIPAPSAPPLVLPSNMFEEGPTSFVPSQTVSPIPVQLRELDGDEFTAIQRELSNIPDIIFDTPKPDLPRHLRYDCLEHYWKHFHPALPIVYKPDFFANKPPPLLLSAVIAIGSYYDTRFDARQYSLALAEIATKLLRKRTEKITEASRNADLQTVLLLEILEKYTARHAIPEPSPRFRALFASLHKSNEALAKDPLALFKSLKANSTTKDLRRAHEYWRKNEERRRVFHACSILDAQQVLLFEQKPTIVSHGSLAESKPITLDLPCADSLWEATTVKEWAIKARSLVPHNISKAIKEYQAGTNTDWSVFQYQIMNIQASSPLKMRKDLSADWNDQSISKTRFFHHLSQMASHTPVRPLLIVAGESWYIGKKVEQEKEYELAKIAIRRWLDLREAKDHFTALFYAIELLRLLIPPDSSLDLLTTHLIHETWAAYLALLIIWAHGYHYSRVQQVLGSPAVQSTSRKRKAESELLTPPRKRHTTGHPSPATTNGPSTAASPVIGMSQSSNMYAVSSAPTENHWTTFTPGPSYSQWPMYYDHSVPAHSTLHDYPASYLTTAADTSTVGSNTRTATNTPLSQASFVTGTTAVPNFLPVQDESVVELRGYLTRTSVNSIEALAKLDKSNFTSTKGVLEAIRNHKISNHRGVSGLMNDANAVLGRLIEGRTADLF